MNSDLRAIRFADTLDADELRPKDLEDPSFRQAIEPAVNEMVELGNSSIRELQRRISDPDECREIPYRDIVDGMEKIMKLARLIEGKSTESVQIRASKMIEKLGDAGENDGPVVYNEGDYE